jgi:hypothetical protein
VRRASSLFVIFFLAIPLAAQTVIGYERLLLPIALPTTTTTPGALGTEWRMELWYENASTRDIGMFQPAQCPIPPCPIFAPANSIGSYPIIFHNPGGNGAFFHVPSIVASQISFSARLMELSRQAQPTGVNLPIVHERDFLRERSTLLGIPAGSGIRSALRVYDLRLQRGSAVQVEVLSERGEVVATAILRPGDHPSVPPVLEPGVPYNLPGFDAIFDITSAFPELAQFERYHLRLTPMNEGALYWAFVSVTHNESQHVLLITPR